MRKTLKEIAEMIGGEIVGSPDLEITGFSGIEEARPGDITFLANPKYAPFLEKTNASAVITSLQVSSGHKALIRAENPSLAFTQVVQLFGAVKARHQQGAHPSAVISGKASLGSNVSVGACAVIEDGASVGDNTVIYAGSYIGYGARVGNGCLIYPNVTVREEVVIGDRVIIHSGSVIGSDGFGYVTVKGAHHKIPQTGTVIIEDDVEIGANVTVDRARFDKTSIGRGTKIDNLVQIAHNVAIGSNVFVVAQAGISGSTKVGDGAIIAGQAGMVGHITIGEGAVVAAQAGVTKSVPPHTMVSGYPAREHASARKINACVQNLPKLMETVSELKRKVEELQSKLK
ncbi:MAG: UDP-3-O-(3-hydroxymyristoyl)glucosamine N-acyltransferase [Candidatus Omnitrophota bacterium]